MRRIHKPRPRSTARQHGGHGCEHHTIIPTRTAGQGRCLECGQLVPTPSWLHAR